MLEERRRDACKWLAGRVSRLAAPGLGLWDRAWEYVEYSTLEFLQALDGWDGGRKGGLLVKKTGDALIAAWREVNEEFLKRGGDDGEEEQDQGSQLGKGGGPPTE